MSESKIKKQVEITHVRGSGKGGQNRNKRWTGVRVVDPQTGISVRETRKRSQTQNMNNALEKLEEKLESHFKKPKRRKKTKPTKSSQKRRIDSKIKHAQKKQNRITIGND